MSYKNSMKLFASNFTLVWKQLAYLLVCLLIFSLCSYAVASPIVDLLKENGVIEEIKDLFNTFYNSPSEFPLRVSDIIKHIISPIITNFSSIWLSLIGTILLCVLLPYVLVQMSIYNITSILGQKFTMNMTVNYSQNAIRNLRRSLKFALANILFNIPYLAIIIALLELYLITARTVMSSIIGLMILSLLLIIVISVKTSIFTYYTGYMVENNAGPFVSFGKGLVQVLKHFWKILGNSVVLLLTIILVNGFVALFTFFSGLLVSIPATFVLIAIYNLVTYFNIKGVRYYLSDTIIFNPVQYTVKKDEYVSVSVPEVTNEINVTTTVIKKKYKKTKPTESKQKSTKTKKK